MTSEERYYLDKAAKAAGEVMVARLSLASGHDYLPDDRLASSVEANALNELDNAIVEAGIHSRASTIGRRENRRDTAYREWLAAHPGDREGALDAGYLAYTKE